jgi:chromosome segregation ATPase
MSDSTDYGKTDANTLNSTGAGERDVGFTLSDVDEQFNTLRDGLEVTSRTFHELWDHYVILLRNYEALFEERNRLRSDNEELIQLREESIRLRSVETSRQELEVSYQSLRSEVEGVRFNYDDLKQKYEALSSANEKLNAELDDLRSNYSIAKQYIEKAKAVEDENRKLLINLEYSREASAQADNLREELKLLQSSKVDLERELIESRKTVVYLQRQNDDMMATNQSSKQNAAEASGERDSLRDRCGQLDKALADAITERRGLEVECNDIKGNYEALKREYEILKREHDKMPKITF